MINDLQEALDYIEKIENKPPYIVEYKYGVESKEIMALIKNDLNEICKIPGWEIYMVKYAMWSDGDIVPCSHMPFASTTDQNEIKAIVKEAFDKLTTMEQTLQEVLNYIER